MLTSVLAIAGASRRGQYCHECIEMCGDWGHRLYKRVGSGTRSTCNL